MKKAMNAQRLAVALFLGLGLALGLLRLLGSHHAVVLAGPAILYVAPGGSCNGVAPCYATVQAAVDAASEGDLIKIAQGTYTDVKNLPSLSTGTFTATQVVAITKTITIRGGYTSTDWETADPAAHPTTLDAQGRGRVMVITGTIAPIIEGVRITGGNATGLGWESAWHLLQDGGGGVYVYTATATISSCVIYNNTACAAATGAGGGLYLRGSTATLNDNVITGNTAGATDDGHGGGLYLRDCDATLSGNTIASNTASSTSYGTGGGLNIWGGSATLRGNTIISNTATEGGCARGGGLYVEGSDATFTDNDISGNVASEYLWGYGGGLFLIYGDALLNNNSITSNIASTSLNGFGGGVSLYGGRATLSGNTVQGNAASTGDWGRGGGIHTYTDEATLSDNVIISNTASIGSWGLGGGLYLYGSGATLIDNVIISNTAGTAEWSRGGGLYLDGGVPMLSGNIVRGNTTGPANGGRGGGLYFRGSAPRDMTNNVITENQASGAGGGLCLEGAWVHLRHSTIARNSSGDGSGIHITGIPTDYGYYYTGMIAVTNTIVTSHTVGIKVTENNTATLNATLWYGNSTNWAGAGTISHSNDRRGEPAFAADGYHLSPVSIAVDRGVPGGVIEDIDGDVRPLGSGYDIGADEFVGTPALRPAIYLPPVPASHRTCRPGAEQAALFEDANYGGQCVVKGIGDYPTHRDIELPYDSISSIKVGQDVEVTLCQDGQFGGLCETFAVDDPDLSDNPIGDDTVSSVRVRFSPCAPGADQVSLFVDADYRGQCVVKPIGEYPTYRDIGLPYDSVSSLKVGANVQATLCEDGQFGGLCELFYGNDPDLSDNPIGDNSASSVRVESRTP